AKGEMVRPVSAHHFAFRPGAWCVNEDEVPVPGFMSYPLAEKIRINHYYYKSQQDFQDKIARGLVTQMKHGAERRMKTFYDHLGEPAFFDDRILRHAARVREFQELAAPALAARVNAFAAADAGALTRDIERALEQGDVEEALRKGRILARHHEGLDLSALGAPAGKAPDRLLPLKLAIATRMRQPDLPLEELRECYVRLAEYYTLSGRPEVARSIGAWLG
ncbi:MAG: hypothetical protein K2G99_05730, partial [Desulfovibrio sp.]|nr:hypothetical protein [Desulfovibrio sp.]